MDGPAASDAGSCFGGLRRRRYDRGGASAAGGLAGLKRKTEKDKSEINVLAGPKEHSFIFPAPNFQTTNTHSREL